MRWINRWNEIDSGCPAAAGRWATSLLVGLWQITHSSVDIRCPPWRPRTSWQLLHCAVVTDVRRGVTAVPVTAKYLIGLNAGSRTVVSAVPLLCLMATLRVMSALA